MVDVTCDGWGRDLDVLARLSEACGVHIVATSGFYIEPHIPGFVHEWSTGRLADHMTREIETGTGARQTPVRSVQVGDTPGQGGGCGVEGADGRGSGPEADRGGDHHPHHG